jgi:hypothetical protein
MALFPVVLMRVTLHTRPEVRRQHLSVQRGTTFGSGNPQAEGKLNCNPLDLIKADLVAPAIVELRGPGRGVVRHRGSHLQRAAVLEIGRDPGRPEIVVAG